MKNLGLAVTHAHNAILADAAYQVTSVVDLRTAERIDRVARAYGFRSLTHLRDELERRTTVRIAYGFIPPFIVE